MAFRDTVAAVAPGSCRLRTCTTVHAWANPAAVGAEFIGIPGTAGFLAPDKKPQVTGIFTDLKVPPQPGLSARIDVDTRFITRPTSLKLAVMVAGIACVVASITALALLDRRWGRPAGGARRHPLSHWPVDAAVIAALLLWHDRRDLSDDGYNLAIARISGEAGYTANYYPLFRRHRGAVRLVSVAAGPDGVGEHGRVWMRLPELLAAIGSWLLLSHGILPRLGSARRGLSHNRWRWPPPARSSWPPGCRSTTAFGPSPDRLRRAGRLDAGRDHRRQPPTGPDRTGDRRRGVQCDAGSAGLVAVAPLLVGSRAVARIIGRRRSSDGLLALIAALAAALSVFFVVVFRDQTLATVAESIRIKCRRTDGLVVSGLPALLLPPSRRTSEASFRQTLLPCW